MPTFNNALEVLRLLDKSNCRECGMPTCLAFAAAVHTGKKQLRDCPRLTDEVVARYDDHSGTRSVIDENLARAMQQLKEEVRQVSLADRAEGLGGVYHNGRLSLKILGKNFSVTDNAEIETDIHVNPWVALPVYNYILRGGKTPLSGHWVPLRELPGGQDWYRLFGQRCEKPLKKIADDNPELFEDMIRLFNAREVEKQYESDISVVLYPLPKVPMLICYWLPDGELDSQLHLFFDDTAAVYLDPNSLNSLGSGFVTMLEKLILQHGRLGRPD